jgi:hypothetical protein
MPPRRATKKKEEDDDVEAVASDDEVSSPKKTSSKKGGAKGKAAKGKGKGKSKAAAKKKKDSDEEENEKDDTTNDDDEKTESKKKASKKEEKKKKSGPWQAPWDVASAPLHVPELDTVAEILEATLKASFKEASAAVVKCPDLTEWGLAAEGITGQISLVDIGGVPNLMDPEYHGVKFNTTDIAKALRQPNVSFLGSGAAVPSAVGGVNAELVHSHHIGNDNNVSQYAKVGTKGEAIVAKYDCDDVGLLCNLLASQGKRGKVATLSHTQTPSFFQVVCIMGMNA